MDFAFPRCSTSSPCAKAKRVRRRAEVLEERGSTAGLDWSKGRYPQTWLRESLAFPPLLPVHHGRGPAGFCDTLGLHRTATDSHPPHLPLERATMRGQCRRARLLFQACAHAGPCPEHTTAPPDASARLFSSLARQGPTVRLPPVLVRRYSDGAARCGAALQRNAAALPFDAAALLFDSVPSRP